MELTHDFRQRTALLLGDERMARLQNARVAVFGLGGVGGACAEALCRAGVGRLTLVDNDTVSLSNINRQIVALHSTVGQPKTAALRARLVCSRVSRTRVSRFSTGSPSLGDRARHRISA